MFGLFKRKRQRTALDAMITAIYGDPPPAKRANVDEAVGMATSLLDGVVSEADVRQHTEALNDSPVPYRTEELAVAVAVHFFCKPELMPKLFTAQLGTRMIMVELVKADRFSPLLLESFEHTLYEKYKPEQ